MGSSVFVAEPQHLTPEARDLLEQAGDVMFAEGGDPELGWAFANVDAVWLRVGHRITADTIGSSPRCRFLAVPATGLDHVDLEACDRQGITVISLRGRTGVLRSVRATAEHTIALMLALLRRLPAAHASVLDGDWDRDRFRGSELAGRRVGVLGVGRLGIQVAQLLQAFGSMVRGFDPRHDFPNDVVEQSGSLDELLAFSEMLTIHVGLDDSTRNLVGVSELSLLPAHAAVINTSRGGVIDEAALLDALIAGRLAGAALDVLADEPSVDAAHHRLVDYARQHENLVITPHIGGNTRESGAATDLVVAHALVEALQDGPR